MTRTLPSGTPTRSKRYLSPADTRRRWLLAALIGGVLLVAPIALYFAGAPAFVSPGDVAADHAAIDLQCAQCHQTGLVTGAVVDLRCERCHDLGASDRLTTASHVLFGSADLRKADDALDVGCTQCHVDHYGRDWVLTEVDDRECATCHQFSTLSGHPEFAAVAAAAQTGLGMKFTHDRHIEEAVNAGLDECASCHVATVDQVAFEPIRFDTHCAACHTDDDGFMKDGTEEIDAGYVLLPDEVPEPWAAEVEVETIPGARGRTAFAKMRHADRWALYNARRLRRAIDPAGEAAEREAIRGRVAYLEQQLAIEPLTTSAAADLDAWAAAFEADVTELERRLIADPTPETDLTALEAYTTGTQTLVDAVATATGEASVPVSEPLPAAPSAVTSGSTADELDTRQAELLALLEAIEARGDEALAERAATLREQVEELEPEPGTQDTAAYRDSLLALDEIVRLVSGVEDPQARYDVAELDVLRSLAVQGVTGGLALDDYETRRQELLSLLTTIERYGSDELRALAEPLRQRALALRAGSDGDADLRRRLRRRQRDLERVRLEQELRRAGESAPEGTAAPVRDRAAVEGELAILRTQLAALEGGSRPGEALGEDRELSGIALQFLLGPCTKCHEQPGAKLAPVAVAEPVMTRARFDHAPHVIQDDCDTCHASVVTSTLATDVNVPGVDTCQSCHGPGEARADCSTCHVYHPPSVAAMLKGT
mgnify:CR=1 FL=1